MHSRQPVFHPFDHAAAAAAKFDGCAANGCGATRRDVCSPAYGRAAPCGRVVLSGILPSQANAVIAAYRPLALQRRLDIDGWTTLVLVRTRRC